MILKGRYRSVSSATPGTWTSVLIAEEAAIPASRAVTKYNRRMSKITIGFERSDVTSK